MVVKFNFFLLCQAQISALAMRARVTLTFDWLALAVKLVLVRGKTCFGGQLDNCASNFPDTAVHQN